MPNEFDPTQKLETSRRFAIIVSRYNSNITSKLCEGAIETLHQNGVEDEHIDIYWVPGAWELSLIAKQIAEKRIHAAIICLGAVIKGETTHDQHINRAVSLAITQASVDTGIPVLFGVLTCESLEQAINRKVRMTIRPND